jgi:molybdenum cofactor biosynthesis protein B
VTSTHPHADAGAGRRAAIAVLTVSDTRSVETDRSGAWLRDAIATAGHQVADHAILPDEPREVRAWVEARLAPGSPDVLLTTGGTGLTSRDRTRAALYDLLDIELPGFGELFRMLSYREIGSAAMLSRAFGGMAQGKFLFVLPGSRGAVQLAWSELIEPELGHLLAERDR